MAQSNAAAKVGTVVLLGFAALAALAYFFFGRAAGGYLLDVSFRDALGIQEQADVMLAGVTVGAVQGIRLDPSGQHAVVRLSIRPEYRIPEGSTFTISSGSLLGETGVLITPPAETSPSYLVQTRENPPLIQGTDTVTIDQLKEQFAQIGAGSREVLANLEIATYNVAKLTGDPALHRAMRTMALSAERATGNVERISNQGLAAANDVRASIRRLNLFIARQEPILQSTLASVERAARQGEPMAAEMVETIRSARALVEDIKETSEFLRTTLDETLQEADAGPALNRALKNLADASEELRAAAANARKISDDLAGTEPDTSKVGAAVTKIGAVADKADELLGKIGSVTDRAGKRRGRLINAEGEVEVFQRVGGESRFRADANLAFGRGSDSAIILGLRDVGEANRLNFQNSSPLTGDTRLRYGFYASRLGVGLDWTLAPGPLKANATPRPTGTAVSFDLYDPNDARLDILGRHQVSERLGLVFGFEGIFEKAHPTVGLTYRP